MIGVTVDALGGIGTFHTSVGSCGAVFKGADLASLFPGTSRRDVTKLLAFVAAKRILTKVVRKFASYSDTSDGAAVC